MTPLISALAASNSRRKMLSLAGLLLVGMGAAYWTSVNAPAVGNGLRVTVGLALAFLAARLLTLRLPQGDDACITLIVGFVGISLWNVWSVMAAAAVAGVVDTAARFTRDRRGAATIGMFDVARGIAVLGLMAPWQLMLRSLLAGVGLNDAMLLVALCAGGVHMFLDIVTLATQQWLFGGARVPDGVRSLMRPLAPVYLVHIALAAVVLRVFPLLGTWGFIIALLLTLVMQNSFNLYMRIRRAYAQTISALVHAAELDRPQDAGHSQRVADLAVALGRQLGLSSAEIERVGYAALLHDLGRIGRNEAEGDSSQAIRGAEILETIPFLEGVAPLVRSHHVTRGSDVPLGATIVGVCCRYDRLRARHGVHAALALLDDSEQGARRGVAEALRRHLQDDSTVLESIWGVP